MKIYYIYIYISVDIGSGRIVGYAFKWLNCSCLMSSTIWLRHSKPPTISVGIRRSVHSAGNPLGMEMATRADPPLTQNLFQTNSLKVNRASHGVWPTARIRMHESTLHAASLCYFIMLVLNAILYCDVLFRCWVDTRFIARKRFGVEVVVVDIRWVCVIHHAELNVTLSNICRIWSTCCGVLYGVIA